MKIEKDIILMYSQLKFFYSNIKINDYATVNAIEVIPIIIGTLSK